MEKEYREQMLKAIKERHSVRNYLERPLEAEVVEKLRAKIAELNKEGRLNIQLVTDEPKGFSGFFAYGKFSGVGNYFVMAGKKDATLNERIGYYGEKLVLYAQMLGLNTCWAGLSYRKVAGTYQLADGEKICCYIAVGYGATQGVSHKIKTLQQVSNAGPDTPEWFIDGVEAALLAPTAINQQKFYFEYVAPSSEGDEPTVIAKKGSSLVGYTAMDLGIAKYHFEVGSDKNPFPAL